MENDLEQLTGYKNSSWSLDLPGEYYSTCVWPIQKRGDADDVLGFLCIDSLDRGIFNKSYDMQVGAAMADGLYAVLKLLHRQRQGVKFSQPPSVPTTTS